MFTWDYKWAGKLEHRIEMGGIVDKGREGMWTDGKKCGLGVKRNVG